MLRWMRPKRKKATAEVASTAVSGAEFFPGPVLTLVPTKQVVESLHRSQAGIGMQGYAPSVAITQGRRYCEYCAEPVHANQRHVCWGNAEHHMHTLTHDERVRIMDQLDSKPRKLTRAQLKKLYSSDGLGPARY